jgi:hypothetical protein
MYNSEITNYEEYKSIITNTPLFELLRKAYSENKNINNKYQEKNPKENTQDKMT